MRPSLSESLGNWGQNRKSGDDSVTERIAAVAEVKGKLPMPVTAPAGEKGARFAEDGLGEARTPQFDASSHAVKIKLLLFGRQRRDQSIPSAISGAKIWIFATSL